MQIDTHVSLSQIVSVVIFLIGIGGSWVSIKLGQKTQEESMEEMKASVKERFDKIDEQISEIQRTYVSEKVDQQNTKLTEFRMSQLEKSIEELKHRSSTKGGS